MSLECLYSPTLHGKRVSLSSVPWMSSAFCRTICRVSAHNKALVFSGCPFMRARTEHDKTETPPSSILVCGQSENVSSQFSYHTGQFAHKVFVAASAQTNVQESKHSSTNTIFFATLLYRLRPFIFSGLELEGRSPRQLCGQIRIDSPTSA